jgi:hypothetical protein
VGLKLIKPSLAHISGHEVQHLGVRFKLREQAYWPYEARETKAGKKQTSENGERRAERCL